MVRLQYHGHFFTRIVPATACEGPLTLPCDHGCDTVIQILSLPDLTVVHQLCVVQAENVAASLLEQVHIASAD